MSVTQWPHLQKRETPTTGPDSQRDCGRWWGYYCYLCCERFFPAWLPLYDSCGKLGGVDSEKKDTDSFSGKLTKLCFYSESFYAWEQGKNLQKSRLHRWSLSTYKVDNSKFTKLMRHIDSIFSGWRDYLLSSRPACYSQHCSHAVLKPYMQEMFLGAKHSETCLAALALHQILVRTFSSRKSRSFPQQFQRTPSCTFYYFICLWVAFLPSDLGF